MSHLGEELKKDRIQSKDLAQAHSYEAFVVADIDAESDGLLARLANQDRTFGPMPWPGAREDGTLLPHRGDRCLITISGDNEDQYWCIAWWPYD